MYRVPDAPRPGVQPVPALLLSLALVATACSQGGGEVEETTQLAATIGEPYEAGAELAVVELAQPSTPSFILRATLPLQPRMFPRRDSQDPFSILTPDGTLVPAQTEVVTWFPKEEKGADVVEVIARVTVAPEHRGASRLVYSVVYDPHEPRIHRLVTPADFVDEASHLIRFVSWAC